MSLAVPARAKLNLDLQVMGRRADGFHELQTTFQAIDLHDLVELTPSEATSFTCEGFAIDPMDNSVVQSHRALEEATGRPLPVAIHLTKRIPPGSGMGGASSDAAATLTALQRMWHLDVDLVALATRLGSDVPFFLVGGCARAEGRGERLTAFDARPQWFGIAWPGFELSTARVYGAWDETRGEPPNALRRAAEHVEPRLREFAQTLGAGWQMTGSGSAFFKKAATEREARQAVEGIECWTAVAAAVPRWA